MVDFHEAPVVAIDGKDNLRVRRMSMYASKPEEVRRKRMRACVHRRCRSDPALSVPNTGYGSRIGSQYYDMYCRRISLKLNIS